MNVFHLARDVTVDGCLIEENSSCGLVSNGSGGLTVTATTIKRNGSTGMFWQGTTFDASASGNTFIHNYTHQAWTSPATYTQTGATGVLHDIRIGTSVTTSTVGSNTFSPA